MKTEKICWICHRSEKEVKNIISHKEYLTLKREFNSEAAGETIYSYGDVLADSGPFTICPVCSLLIYQTMAYLSENYSCLLKSEQEEKIEKCPTCGKPK